jgi:hypothetical protein
MMRTSGKGSLFEMIKNERMGRLALAAFPAVFVVLLALLGGVRGFSALLLIGASVFVVLSLTFWTLPEDGESVPRRRRRESGVGRDFSLGGRLGVDIFKKPTKKSFVEWFDPSIGDDAMLDAMVYLSSNGYIVDSGFKTLLSEADEEKLRTFMIEKGFAYPTDEVYHGGWSLNAAGRSMINRYLTHMLIRED